MSQTIEVKVPDIGDYKDIPVIEVLVKPGDTVDAETPLVTLESDKATMDVPSPSAGVVKDLRIKVGDKVSMGTLVLTLESAGAAAAPAAAPAPAAAAPARAAPAPAKTPVAAAPAPAATGATIEVTVPDIGDYKDIPVIEVFVKAGDTVDAETPLVTLESDKATMDVPSPAAGVIKELKLKVGDKVSKGTLVLTLASAGAPAAAAAPAPSAAPARVAAAPAASAPAAAPARAAAPTASLEPMNEASLALAHASPSVRRFARELGADLGKVRGSGPKGRILKEDVQAYVKGELTRPKAAAGSGGLNVAPMPVVDFAKFGPVETQALTRIKKLSGAALHRNWVTIPHVTQLDEADITELEAFRKGQADELKKQGVRLTLIAFLLKACVVALKQYPNFNASLAPDGESLILKKYFHIGVAVDTPLGLVVPVLRDVDKKGLVDLARELGDISARMRDGKINPADLQGGCFSISSLGGIGGTAFTPIINAPEVAILGVSKGQLKPVWDGKQFVPRLMLPLSLSYDHRVVDGAQGAHFITFLSSVLSDIRRLSL